MSQVPSADHGKFGRVIGVSLAGLWLTVSMIAAIADTATDDTGSAIVLIESGEVLSVTVPVDN
jgi:hypothetical protein